MTKGDLINAIAEKTGIEKVTIQKTIEAFMETVKDSMVKGNNVYLRGFGSFIVKKRAKKAARNISKNTTIIISAHNIPAFIPSKIFITKVKSHYKKSKPHTEIDDNEPDLERPGTDDDGPKRT